jgi:hypothetical protein
MKKRHVFLSLLMIAVGLTVVISSCKKEEEDFTLVTLTADDIDLNTATSPDDVSVNPTITATFSTDVDASTATSDNVTLIQDYDDTSIDITISVSGAVVTVTPDADLATGTLYKISFGPGLLSTGGKALDEFPRTFTTEGTFAPSGVIAHWTFEDNANDVVGDWDPPANGIVAITYTDSRNTDAGKAATFDGDASIIEIPDGDELINTDDFTISFWVKTNSTDHVDANGNPAGHFVLGLGAHYGIQYEMYASYDGAKFAIQYELANGSTTSEDMWFPSEATDKDNGGWQGWDYAKSISQSDMIAKLKDKWLNVVYTYDATEKKGTLYYNGEKMKSFDFDLWPDGDPKQTIVGLKYGGSEPDVVNKLAFGFIQSRDGTLWSTEPWGNYDLPTANHFKGQLDDVRIFHKAITAEEVSLMYESEKP